MRPDCVLDPTKPGACFVTPPMPVEANIICPGEGELVWVNIFGKNDFFRINQDGTTYVHSSDPYVDTGFCLLGEFPGDCPADPLKFFRGKTKFQANGVIDPATLFGLCPFVLKSKGELTREVDGETIMIKAEFVLLPDPDSPGDCRIHKCQIISPHGNNDE